MKKFKEMTLSAVRRIQSAEGKANNGQTPKGSFAPRAQSTVARRPRGK